MTHASLTVRKVALKSALPHPRNPRVHPPKGTAGYEALRKSLLNEYFDPLVWNKRTGHLVSGHYRRMILLDEGYRSADMVVVDWDEPTHLARMLAANELNGQFDDPKLLELLRTIGQDLSQDLTGLTDDRIKALLALAPDEPKQLDAEPQIDRAAELAKKWRVKPGQIWQLGEHRLMCGDSTKAEDVGRLMGGDRSALMNTDPPYGVDLAAVKPKGVGFNTLEERGGIENDDLTDGAELQAFLERMIRAALPHLTENPAFYLWHPMLTQGTFFAAAAADILIHRQIIWVKPHMVLTRSGMYHWKHELCFYGWIKGKPCEWFGDKSQVSVWEIGETSQNRMHPTQKPLELFERPLLNHTHQGDPVYEPFSGSGSQLLACERLSRRCRAMEISPAYVAVGLQRWADATSQTPALL